MTSDRRPIGAEPQHGQQGFVPDSPKDMKTRRKRPDVPQGQVCLREMPPGERRVYDTL